MRFCEKCGSKIEEGTLFCEKCGAKVKEDNKKEIEEKEPPRPPRPPKSKSGKGKVVLLAILDVLLLAAAITFLVLWLTKGGDCKASNGNGNGGNGNGSENGNNGNNNGNNKKADRSPEYLFDQYVKGYTKSDPDALKIAFTPYYNEYMSFSKDTLKQYLSYSKNIYGDDFTIKYKINGKKKLTSSELEDFNDQMEYQYDTDMKAKECYKLDGTITFTGSSYEDTDELESLYYCNYDGTWYLAG